MSEQSSHRKEVAERWRWRRIPPDSISPQGQTNTRQDVAYFRSWSGPQRYEWQAALSLVSTHRPEVRWLLPRTPAPSTACQASALDSHDSRQTFHQNRLKQTQNLHKHHFSINNQIFCKWTQFLWKHMFPLVPLCQIHNVTIYHYSMIAQSIDSLGPVKKIFLLGYFSPSLGHLVHIWKKS